MEKVDFADLWEFVQMHKKKTARQFQKWISLEAINPHNIVVKACVRYNSYQKKK